MAYRIDAVVIIDGLVTGRDKLEFLDDNWYGVVNCIRLW